jgi:mannose-1-phosphate guanylyltransferase/phosphomannomutase
VGGEKIFLVDEHGQILDDLTAAALMVELALYTHPGRTVAVPAVMPNAIDTIAAWHQGQVLRINNNLHSLMTTAQQSDILLVTDGTGNFIFPPFQPAVDGMMAVACLLEYLAARQAPLSEVVSYLPPMNLVRHLVNCPWDAKARVMRELHRQHTVNISDNIDGLKICLDNHEWVHIAPDPDRPYLEVVAEGQDPERAQQLVNQFSAQIQALIETSNQP